MSKLDLDKLKKKEYKYKSVYLVLSEPLKRAGNVYDYFMDNSDTFIFFSFPLGFSTSYSYVEIYKKRELKQTIFFDFYSGSNNKIKFLFYYFYFNYVLIKYAPQGTWVLSNFPTFFIFNFVFKFLKRVKFIFWIGDYYPSRKFPVIMYHLLVEYLNKSLKYILYVSPPLEKIYAEKRGNKFKKLVTFGFGRNNRQISDQKKSKIVLGFIGIIRDQQGLDLTFNYIKNSQNVVIEVVGNGYMLNHYKSLASKLGINKKVKFLGHVDDIESIFRKWHIGLALYENVPSNLSLYCEPTKIKNYLSYGLPVITTKTTYFGSEVKKNRAGEVIDEDVDSLSKAIRKINANYNEYLNGVNRLNHKYEFNKWYDDKFAFIIG